MDNLAAARSPAPPPLSLPSASGRVSNKSTVLASEMPTVIVSAAPDVDDSAEEGGGSDTSADDGLGDNLSGSFRSAFGGAGELELIGPAHLSLDDLPGQITRLLGKSNSQNIHFLVNFKVNSI